MVTEAFDICVSSFGSYGGANMSLAGTHFKQSVVKTVSVCDCFK